VRIANEGLKRNRAGQVVLQLKSAFKDGTTHIEDVSNILNGSIFGDVCFR